MSVAIVRLGDPRLTHEGVRIGTVRRPPRAVPKADIARLDYYDVWLPLLAPSPALVREAHQAQRADTDRAWQRFARRFRREMMRPDAAHALDLLAALSHTADFSVGCYCAEERRCHRSLLRALLLERGARLRT